MRLLETFTVETLFSLVLQPMPLMALFAQKGHEIPNVCMV